MSLSTNKEKLDSAKAQLGVNVVSTTAAQELAGDSTKLFKLQTALSNNKDKILEVREILDDLEDHEITLALAKFIDSTLERAGVDITPVKDVEVVMGAEALGRGLTPRDFRLTRVAAMENFLLDFFRKTKEVTKLLANLFSESFTLFTTNLNSLEQTLENLESSLELLEDFKADNKVNLGTGLYTLFQQEGGVSGEWVKDLTRLRGTVKALTNNYIANNVGHLQRLYSYFGGFDKVDTVKANMKLSMLASSIKGVPFKECSYNLTSKDNYLDNKESDLVVKRSVKLLGGRYFVDIRHKNPNSFKVTDIDTATDYVKNVLVREGTRFYNESSFNDRNNKPVNSLASREIKQVLVLLRDILNEWRKLYVELDSKKLNPDEYRDIRRAIFDNSDISEDIRAFAIENLDLLTTQSQVELVNIGSGVNRYLTLLISGMVDLINLSIEANGE